MSSSYDHVQRGLQMLISTQSEFAAYCLRKLGEPVIQVNLDTTQIDDAIDDAIFKFTEYHRDGYEEHYFAYTFQTAQDAETRTISVPENLGIDDIVSVISPGSSAITNRFDTYAWQAGAAINSPISGGWANTSLQDYTAMMQRLADLNAVLGDVFPFRFSTFSWSI